MSSTGAGAKYGDEMVNDSGCSLSPSPIPSGRCFCGKAAEYGNIYCSAFCARSDAINTLCCKSSRPSSLAIPGTAHDHQSMLNGHLLSNATESLAHDSKWHTSHYRHLARADLRRQERLEERRKRRAEGSISGSISGSNRGSIPHMSSISLRAVPDLVGGHSRASSAASSVVSHASSAFVLSRNPSIASNSSKRGHGGVNMGSAIVEDEQEWLQSDMAKPHGPGSVRKNVHRKRKDNGSRRRKNTPDTLPFGMGQDMRDVLEEIIQLEKSFLVSDDEEDIPKLVDRPPPRLFTAHFDHLPRTPPSYSKTKRAPLAPGAPGPIRGHRSTLSQDALALPQTPRYEQQRGSRPPSFMHQSSLSESHTALYLATASPLATTRRSASPQLMIRQSLTFHPDIAGPSINLPDSHDQSAHLAPPLRGFDANSPMVTPMSRRSTHNRTPQVIHPPIDGWRFPSPMSVATPTRPVYTLTSERPLKGLGSNSLGIDYGEGKSGECIGPVLLWPPQRTESSNLQPSPFPESPAPISRNFGSNCSSGAESEDTLYASRIKDDGDVDMSASPMSFDGLPGRPERNSNHLSVYS
ncbi:hypothetical protein L204_104931 [Cryptococcus depauperatus]|nr:hypothetical protein L204_05438 [Cryptococcus depauperatus CBS 7855]